VPIKSFPELTEDYFRKINELNADYVFILDKPVVSQEFFKRIEEVNIPTVWIDHHTIDKKDIPDFVDYYNPLFNEDKNNEPVTVLCQQINDRKKDLWLAVVGSISDKFVPDFYSDFEKDYPELSIKSESAFEIFYNSQIGKIVKLFSFALKDKTTNVITMLKFLMKVKTPHEVLEKSNKNYIMHERFDQIDRKYQKLLIKAEEISVDSKKVLFFQYGGDMSISSDLANELTYRFPKKIIVVIYLKGIKANISVRGKKIKDKILEVIKNLKEATGGGHEDAVGAQINVEDVEKFRERFSELVK
jgi:single-stranded DNA-specific DHH superfamily exonuclease